MKWLKAIQSLNSNERNPQSMTAHRRLVPGELWTGLGQQCFPVTVQQSLRGVCFSLHLSWTDTLRTSQLTPGLNSCLALFFLCSFYTVTVIQPLPTESWAPQEKRTSVKISIKRFLDYQLKSIIDRTWLKTKNEQVGDTGQLGTFLNRDVIVHLYTRTTLQLPHIALEGRPETSMSWYKSRFVGETCTPYSLERETYICWLHWGIQSIADCMEDWNRQNNKI